MAGSEQEAQGEKDVPCSPRACRVGSDDLSPQTGPSTAPSPPLGLFIAIRSQYIPAGDRGAEQVKAPLTPVSPVP